MASVYHLMPNTKNTVNSAKPRNKSQNVMLATIVVPIYNKLSATSEITAECLTPPVPPECPLRTLPDVLQNAQQLIHTPITLLPATMCLCCLMGGSVSTILRCLHNKWSRIEVWVMIHGVVGEASPQAAKGIRILVPSRVSSMYAVSC
jgi:hypothetical protein